MGQFITEMIIGAGALAGIIAYSKGHNLFWIPLIGFLVGYSYDDASYVYSNVFGGLTFSFLTSLIAGYWFKYQNKKKVDQ